MLWINIGYDFAPFLILNETQYSKYDFTPFLWCKHTEVNRLNTLNEDFLEDFKKILYSDASR